MEGTSQVQRSTSRPSTSPTCWFAKLRWSSPATWLTGPYSTYKYPVVEHYWSRFTKIRCCVATSLASPPLSPSPPLVKKKKKKSSVSCWLPWWCVFLGWFLLLSISGVSTFFTLLYGFEYGKEKSIKWVMSLGLSLFQSIFILQPLKVCKMIF